MDMLSPEDRARRIKVLLYDVDGVLTNGEITFIPELEDPNAATAQAVPRAVEVKSFSAHDGLGVAIARLAGLKVGWITKRNSRVVAIRAADLRIDHLYQGQSTKREALRNVMAAEACTLEEIAYVGDDIIDLPVMRIVGLAIASANARPEAKAAAHYVTPNPGGQGAGRDAIDFILRARGVLEETIERYLAQDTAEARAADVGAGNM
jgi:3-deoxy-D-manno-octulosonate 8-phosphate phosphatase (KDO 8-P phosphatase)